MRLYYYYKAFTVLFLQTARFKYVHRQQQQQEVDLVSMHFVFLVYITFLKLVTLQNFLNAVSNRIITN